MSKFDPWPVEERGKTMLKIPIENYSDKELEDALREFAEIDLNFYKELVDEHIRRFNERYGT